MEDVLDWRAGEDTPPEDKTFLGVNALPNNPSMTESLQVLARSWRHYSFWRHLSWTLPGVLGLIHRQQEMAVTACTFVQPFLGSSPTPAESQRPGPSSRCPSREDADAQVRSGGKLPALTAGRSSTWKRAQRSPRAALLPSPRRSTPINPRNY